MVFISQCLNGQSAGSRSASLATAGITIGDTWSVVNNPAFLCQVSGSSLGLSAEYPYLLKELAGVSLGFAAETHRGGIGAMARESGNADYRDLYLTAGYGHEFFKSFIAGISLCYSLVSMPGGSGPVQSVGATIAMGISAGKGIYLAFLAANPGGLHYCSSRAMILVSTYKTGLSIKLQGNGQVFLEAEKEANQLVRFKVACEFTIKNRFRAGTGIMTAPVELSFGAGINSGKLWIEIASSLHQYLGHYPRCSIIYAFRP